MLKNVTTLIQFLPRRDVRDAYFQRRQLKKVFFNIEILLVLVVLLQTSLASELCLGCYQPRHK